MFGRAVLIQFVINSYKVEKKNTPDVYSSPLQNVSVAVRQIKPVLVNTRGAFLFYDNASQHTAKASRDVIKMVG